MERKSFSYSSGKVRLKSLDDLDHRTRAARSAQALKAAIVEDLGGAAGLSSMQLALITNAALIAAMLEDAGTRFLAGERADPTSYATLTNCLRRTFSELGLQRRARDISPDLKSYLRGKAKAAA